MNQCRRCHTEIPEGETLCEACKANDENYLDDLLRSMDGTKTDHRSDLPQKKGASTVERNRNTDRMSSAFSDDKQDLDELDLEFSRRLGRGRGRNKRGRGRRSRREDIKAVDFDLEGKNTLSPDKDFSAVRIADSLLDVLEDESEAYDIPEAEEESLADNDDIMAMLSEDDASAGEEPIVDDDIMAMLSEDDANAGEEPAADDDIMAMLSEDDSNAGEELAVDDDIMAMLSEDNADAGEEPVVDDDIMAMLSEDDANAGEEPAMDDDIMAMLSEDNADAGEESAADDDIMAMLSEGDDNAQGEDDIMAMLSDEGGAGEIDDELMALMNEAGLMDSDSDNMGDLEGMLDSDGDMELELDGDDKDIFSLDDLMGEDGDSDDSPKEGKISDLGDVLSDSLSAVSSKEEEALEAQILNSVDDNKEKKKGKGKAGAFFAKLFGNIVDDKSKKQFEAEKEDEKKAEFKKSEKARIKAGNLTEEELKKKADKEAAIAQAKEEKKQKKDEKKAQADAKKAEKIEKKKKLAQQRAEEEALTVDEGRINRAGASVVFIFFAAVALVVLIGSTRFSYATSIKKATNYFDKQKYNNAYNEVSGLKIKDRDEEIYSKIMTVMYVNKELNSYNNYYDIQHYGEALDSLLKGLKRYDKYISDARELGIESDLNYVRRQILAELKRTFGISEAEAVRLNGIEDRLEYSNRVISAAETVIEK